MRIAIAATLLSLTTACTPAPPATVAASTPTSTTAATTSAPIQTTTSAGTATAAPVAPAVKTCTMPNVVGLIHQTAQDTMQKAGLLFLSEEDANGQGRLLINDRNWKTTKQNVAAGTVVDCNTKILLSAEKMDG
ncbi:PASTA domain-containing protein [Lentzea sp. NPDC034063]|uniref:PASTA domain-containing protein n=1 Tax=unclassified Lentzea TaxID=2643253 RepID=UPI0033E2CD81